MNFREKAIHNSMSSFEKLLDIQKAKDSGKFYYSEAAAKDEEEIGGETSIVPDEKEKKEPKEKKPVKDDDGKDAMDRADDVLKNIDFKAMDNDTKVELIESAIEALQNDCETDDEFSDYMNKLLDVIDGYKFEKEDEEKEEKPKKKEKKEDKEDKEEKPEDSEMDMELDVEEK